MSFLRVLNRPIPPLIEERLHVIAVVSNPCLYRRRYQLAREFFARMARTTRVALYVVELAYGDQEFALTQAGHPRHLQLRTDAPMWHKENMINLGVRKLLPANWRAFAWIDADIEFENPRWAEDTLRALSNADVVQPFQHSVLLDEDGALTSDVRTSTCASVVVGGRPAWGNCGYAWAMTRKAYMRTGGLYELGIMGGGDGIMAKAFTGHGNLAQLPDLSAGFRASVLDYEARGRTKVGFAPGRVRHYFHGELKNRKYTERWDTLVRHAYDPTIHLTRDAQGLLVPSPACPPGLLADILAYFRERNEDASTADRPEVDPPPEAGAHTPTASSQCNDSQSPAEASAPPRETTPGSENSVARDLDEAFVGTLD